MNGEHKPQSELVQELSDAAALITIGGLYGHYKNRSNTYTVTGLGFLEATDELCVIYQAEYGERVTFIRPLTVWLEQVDWQGQTVPRFVKIEVPPQER